MASYYVYSGAGGANNGSDWTNAFTTLAAAFTAEAAGDTLYVAHDHNELAGTAIACNSSGTLASVTKIICVNRAGSVPPVSADRRTTAVATSNANNNVTFTGVAHYDGIIFVAGNSTGAASITPGAQVRFDNCSLRIGSTGSGSIAVGSFGGQTAIDVQLNNTTASFSGVGQTFNISGYLRWRNTASALIGTAVPTTLFTPFGSGRGADIECIGVDLSAAGSGKTIVGASTTASNNFKFVDCKLNASVTKSAVPLSSDTTTRIDFIRSASSGVNYTIFRHRITGTLNEETTIVRTGGASDGTTAIAWKIDTTANCSYSLPFECPPIAIWNDSLSSVTATVEGIWGGGAVPNDDDVFLECEYLGSSSSPQGSFIDDGKANLLTAAAGQTSSSETWGGSTTKFKLAVSFTPQQKGWIYARVKCAKPSSTFYIDPLVTLT